MILRKKSVFSSISILSKKILEEFLVKKVVDGDSFFLYQVGCSHIIKLYLTKLVNDLRKVKKTRY